jgi:hypothetical protein
MILKKEGEEAKIFLQLARDDDDNGSGGDNDDDDDTPRDYIPHKTSPGGTGTRPPIFSY